MLVFRHESLPVIVDALIGAKKALEESRPDYVTEASDREHKNALNQVENALKLAKQALPKEVSSSLKELL